MKSVSITTTKKVEAIFKRYGVVIRDHHSTVTHLTTGATTHCDPLTFAIFEAATKAVYLSNAVSPFWPSMCAAGHGRHYEALAARNGFHLPDIPNDELLSGDWQKVSQRAAADYHYCAAKLLRAGSYYALLD